MEDLSAPPHNLAPLHVVIARQLKMGHQFLAGVTLNYNGCRQLFLTNALRLAQVEMKRLVEEDHLLHRDGGILNILFSPGLTSAKFIDWGRYAEHKVCTISTWNPQWYILITKALIVYLLFVRSGMMRLKNDLPLLEINSYMRRLSCAKTFQHTSTQSATVVD